VELSHQKAVKLYCKIRQHSVNRKKELPLLGKPVWTKVNGVGCQQMVATTCSFSTTSFPFLPCGAVDWMHACITFYTSKLGLKPKPCAVF